MPSNINIHVNGVVPINCQEGKIKYKADECYCGADTQYVLYGDTDSLATATVLYKDDQGTVADTGYYCCDSDPKYVYYWDGNKKILCST